MWKKKTGFLVKPEQKSIDPLWAKTLEGKAFVFIFGICLTALGLWNVYVYFETGVYVHEFDRKGKLLADFLTFYFGVLGVPMTEISLGAFLSYYGWVKNY